MTEQSTSLNPALLDTAEAEESIMLGISIDLKNAMRDAEVQLVRVALGQSKGNVSRAARLLGLNRTTLHEKMRRHEI